MSPEREVEVVKRLAQTDSRVLLHSTPASSHASSCVTASRSLCGPTANRCRPR
jgi:hypothetical protein